MKLILYAFELLLLLLLKSLNIYFPIFFKRIAHVFFFVNLFCLKYINVNGRVLNGRLVFNIDTINL